MTGGQGLVLDANILIRAVLGKRVRNLLEQYESTTDFFSPEVCFHEARQHLPTILHRRGLDPAAALSLLDGLALLVQPVEHALYQAYAAVARQRLTGRDLRDWPVAALALALGLPIWTEDQDFFGSGIATWTTDRVELYLLGS